MCKKAIFCCFSFVNEKIGKRINFGFDLYIYDLRIKRARETDEITHKINEEYWINKMIINKLLICLLRH